MKDRQALPVGPVGPQLKPKPLHQDSGERGGETGGGERGGEREGRRDRSEERGEERGVTLYLKWGLKNEEYRDG